MYTINLPKYLYLIGYCCQIDYSLILNHCLHLKSMPKIIIIIVKVTTILIIVIINIIIPLILFLLFLVILVILSFLFPVILLKIVHQIKINKHQFITSQD
mmetsp:Transcript_13246/g.1934  ORF Transcript_13246/g.1934 Transcript_13246/m.1934 type:complete len:100 (-) Transcript_13246:17-316(-)